MRAVDCSTNVEPDELALEFDHAFVVDGNCYAFTFQLSFSIEGVVRSELVAVSHESFASFVKQLVALNDSLTGRARMNSKDCAIYTRDVDFNIESHGNRGYLAVRVSLGLSEFSSFTGGFIAEPACLANWTCELQRVLECKNPSVDFYGNWNTTLPLPQRLRKLANDDRTED